MQVRAALRYGERTASYISVGKSRFRNKTGVERCPSAYGTRVYTPVVSMFPVVQWVGIRLEMSRTTACNDS